MAQARIDAVCEAVRAKVVADFSADALFPLNSDNVVWDYSPEISLNPDDDNAIEGLKIFVFGDPDGAYGQISTASRGKDIFEYTVQVVIWDQFRPQGRPDRTWIADRIEFVSRLYDGLGDVRGYELLSGMWAESTSKVVAVDPEYLTEHKVFRSEFSVTFREFV